MFKPYDLGDKVALVTGGRRGIGRGIALRLAAAGAAVILTGEKLTDEGLEETREFIERVGGKAAVLACDLADAQSREGLIQSAQNFFGPIDILVNNAAFNSYEYASTMPVSSRNKIFEINFHGPVDLIQQALPAMLEKKWGRILNICSETMRQAPIPYPGPEQYVHGLAVYGASKIALERYTFGLAAELHGSGVHVNATYPYRVCVTEMNSAAAKQSLKAHPDWAESVEMMAEASMALIGGTLTGISKSSREIVQMLQQPLHGLDGKTITGDARTLATLD